MPDVRLPGTLSPLFPGLPRRLELEAAASVLDAIDELEQRWPGLRDRLVAEGPSLRSHIHVYVDGERAALDTPVAERSRLDVIAAISGG
ncbi:MAG TPA: MoaD/ThiS family protein [Gaiellaceae bacterium]|nr:MoaD/ThiS family protein [Gaiellaceae bacterium]